MNERTKSNQMTPDDLRERAFDAQDQYGHYASASAMFCAVDAWKRDIAERDAALKRAEELEAALQAILLHHEQGNITNHHDAALDYAGLVGKLAWSVLEK